MNEITDIVSSTVNSQICILNLFIFLFSSKTRLRCSLKVIFLYFDARDCFVFNTKLPIAHNSSYRFLDYYPSSSTARRNRKSDRSDSLWIEFLQFNLYWLRLGLKRIHVVESLIPEIENFHGDAHNNLTQLTSRSSMMSENVECFFYERIMRIHAKYNAQVQNSKTTVSIKIVNKSTIQLYGLYKKKLCIFHSILSSASHSIEKFFRVDTRKNVSNISVLYFTSIFGWVQYEAIFIKGANTANSRCDAHFVYFYVFSLAVNDKKKKIYTLPKKLLTHDLTLPTYWLTHFLVIFFKIWKVMICLNFMDTNGRHLCKFY